MFISRCLFFMVSLVGCINGLYFFSVHISVLVTCGLFHVRTGVVRLKLVTFYNF